MDLLAKAYTDLATKKPFASCIVISLATNLVNHKRTRKMIACICLVSEKTKKEKEENTPPPILGIVIRSESAPS